MEVMLKNGTKAEIADSEVDRIRGESRRSEKKMYAHRNKEYLEKALDILEDKTGMSPTTEREVRDILHKTIPLSEKHACILIECMKALIGMHSEKIHKHEED